MTTFGRKSEILNPKSETDRMEAERQIPAHLTEYDLKKQSQFAGWYIGAIHVIIIVYGDFGDFMDNVFCCFCNKVATINFIYLPQQCR